MATATEKALEKATAILEEVMDKFDHPEEQLTAIWDAWFDRMRDGVHPFYMTSVELAALKECFDEAYAELTSAS